MNLKNDKSLRLNAMTVIHKYIRHELFAMCQVLAKAAPDQVEVVQTALQSVVGLLYDHAEHEDKHLSGLLEKVDDALAQRMRWDHKRLDKHLEDILELAWQLNAIPVGVRASQLLQLYLDWNRFVGAYLAHLDDEERTLFPAIHEQLPPVAVVAQNAVSQPTEDRQRFMANFKAALTADEFRMISDEVTAQLAQQQLA